MPDFEFLEDFDDGQVFGASFQLRPDSVVSLVSTAPGPTDIGDPSEGILFKGWYARPSGLSVIYSYMDGSDWSDEAELFSVSGDQIDMLSLAFDSEAYPSVAMQRDDRIWIRYWNGSSYTLSNLAEGEAPSIITRSAGTPFAEVILFYQRGTDLYWRAESEDYSVEHDAEVTLAVDQKLWRAILGNGRIHLIISTHDEPSGTYELSRISEEEYAAGCLKATGYADRIDDGSDSLIIWREDGTIETLCDVECDILIVAAGGDSGGSAAADDSIVWANASGEALDPDSDSPYSPHRALGGGGGGSIDLDGASGGSGGGGGAQSPSNNAMWTAGGRGTIGQGHNGGGGQSTWGLLDPKRGASGGGGGYGFPGGGGLTLQGSPLTPGSAGRGALVDLWNWFGPRGGRGDKRSVASPTSTTNGVPGGGGAGGVQTVQSLTIPAGQTIQLEVGQGNTIAAAGRGGELGGSGITGMIAMRIRRISIDEFDEAELSGGTESTFRGYQFHRFTADGSLTVNTPGVAEILLLGGGGGGGSDAGGGGGAGDFRIIRDVLSGGPLSIEVGAGGAGGTSGGAGSNGEASSVESGEYGEALGGGGGAGQGTAAGSDASGGGGHGDDGAGGAGKAMRAYPGGNGGGYPLSAGGSVRHAGGGGGLGSGGDIGATEELTGDPLATNWEAPAAGALQPVAQEYRITLGGGQDYSLIGTNVSVQEMMVQGKVRSGHSNLRVGIMARARHPTADPDEVATGYYAFINHNFQRFRSIGYAHALSSTHHIQIYAEDDLQQYSVYGPNGASSAVSLLRDSGTDAGQNGNDRSFGFRAQGDPISGTGKAGVCDDLMCFKSKWLEIGSVPAGGSVEVYNTEGELVASASESSGTALVDLSMYGNGTTGAIEPVPFDGWPDVVVKNSGGVVVASAAGSFYPGGEFDVSGSTLVVREDSSGGEPIPIIGLLQFSTFNELTPGPYHGDGGQAIELDEVWRQGASIGASDGKIGGGGGGGSESTIAGLSGGGGSGAGAFDVAAPGSASANTGSGGGGSGDSTVNGGAGGSGLVVARTLIPQPALAEIPSSGIIVHHDAKSITGLEDGEEVSVWPDDGPNGDDLVAVGSPIYRDGLTVEGINGWPAVRLGVNNYMQYTSAIMNGVTEGEVFAVVKNDDDGVVQNGFWDFTNGDFSSHHPWTDGTLFEVWGRANRINATNPAPSLLLPHLYHVRSISGEYTVRLNGAQIYTNGTNTPSFLSTTPFPSIGKSESTYYWRGLWGHLLVYDRALTPSERSGIELYLNWYWTL